MTNQNQTKTAVNNLHIRNQCIAVFAAMYLQQNPRIERDSNNNVVFSFASELSFREINLLYRGSEIQRALEMNIAFGQEKKRLLNNPN